MAERVRGRALRTWGLYLLALTAWVTVVLLLFIYALVIAAAIYIGDRDSSEETFRAPRWLLVVGLVGNLVLLVYVIVDDPTSVIWCLGLIAVGAVLFVAEQLFGRRDRSPGAEPGTAQAPTEKEN